MRRSEASIGRSPGASAPGSGAVAQAVAAFARGDIVLLMRSRDRAEEHCLAMAAELATGQSVMLMAARGRRPISVPMPAEDLQRLGIPPLPDAEQEGPAFHVGVDAAESSIGVSARDLARTIRALADPTSSREDFRRPGHVFPMACEPGGVLRRAEHAEAAIDLALEAGLAPAAVLCGADVEEDPADRWVLPPTAPAADLVSVSIEELVAYRRRPGNAIHRAAECLLPTPSATFRAIGYRDDTSGAEHLALVLGDPAAESAPAVHVHVACMLGDVLRAATCDCRERLDRSIAAIAERGSGVLVYVREHGSAGVAGAGGSSFVPRCHRQDPRDAAVAARLLDNLRVL